MKTKVLNGSYYPRYCLSFLLLTVLGIIYALINHSEGVTLTVSIQSYINLVLNLRSLFPYLTTLPVILFLLMLTIKNKTNILNLFRG